MKPKIKLVLAVALAVGITTLAFAATPPAEVELKPETVLVSNSLVTVTYEDLLAELERLPKENYIEVLLNPKRLGATLENLMINKLMAAEARKSGLQNTPRAVAEIRNSTERVLAKYRREELLANAPKVELAPLARELFLTRLKDMERPALYASWHTLIKMADRTPEAAMERAKLVKAKIDAGGQLEVIARQYSDDASVEINGGMIEATPLSKLDANFGSALEKLKANESAIVKSDYGIHVVRLIKMIPQMRPSFEDVKPAMLEEAELAYKQRVEQAYLETIRADKTLEYHKPEIDALRPKLPKLPEIPPPAQAK
jgi:PPIC-type PPIASE domain